MLDLELVTRRLVMKRGAAIQMKRTSRVHTEEAVSSEVSKWRLYMLRRTLMRIST